MPYCSFGRSHDHVIDRKQPAQRTKHHQGVAHLSCTHNLPSPPVLRWMDRNSCPGSRPLVHPASLVENGWGHRAHHFPTKTDSASSSPLLVALGRNHTSICDDQTKTCR